MFVTVRSTMHALRRVPRDATTMLSLGILVVVVATLIAFVPALFGSASPQTASVSGQPAVSLAQERKADHEWLAERNAAYAKRWAELPDSWMERPAGPGAAPAVDYLWEYEGVDRTVPAQAVPSAEVQSVSDYLQVHASVDEVVPAQAVPSAEVQGVNDYLQAHKDVDAATMQAQRNRHLLEVNEDFYPSERPQTSGNWLDGVGFVP